MNTLWIPLLLLKILFIQGVSFKFLQQEQQTECNLRNLNLIANSIVFDSSSTAKEFSINIDDGLYNEIAKDASTTSSVNLIFDNSVTDKITHACTLSEKKEISCSFSNVNELPPGTYNILIEKSQGNTCSTNLLLVSIQIASASSQVYFDYLDVADDQCLPLQNSKLYVKVKSLGNFSYSLVNESNPMTVVFIGKTIKSKKFEINCSKLNSTYLTCDYATITDAVADTYVLYNIFYKEGQDQPSKTAFIEDRKKSFTLASSYYYIPSEGNTLNQNIFFQDNNSNKISFIAPKPFPQENLAEKILFYNGTYNKLSDNNKFSVVASDTANTITITITLSENDLAQGEYALYFVNGCGNNEKSPITIYVDVNVVVELQSFQGKCYKGMDSFTFTNKKPEKTGSFSAALIGNSNRVEYRCGSPNNENVITCNKSSPTGEIPAGWYNFSVSYTEGTNTTEVFILNQKEIRVDSQFAVLTSTTSPNPIAIGYGSPDNYFDLTFNETFKSSSIKINLTLVEGEKVYYLECSSVRGTPTSKCLVEDPVSLPSGKKYTITHYKDDCDNNTISPNLSVETKKMEIGSVDFNKNDQKCTKSINEFTINIKKYGVSASNITGILRTKDTEPKEIKFNCSNISMGAYVLSCYYVSDENTPSTIADGIYYFDSLVYIPSNGTHLASESIKLILNSSSEAIHYKSNFNELGDNTKDILIKDKDSTVTIYYTGAPIYDDLVTLTEKNSGFTIKMQLQEKSGNTSIYKFTGIPTEGMYNIIVTDACQKTTTLPNQVNISISENIHLGLIPNIDSSTCYTSPLTLSFNYSEGINQTLFQTFTFTLAKYEGPTQTESVSTSNTFSNGVIKSIINGNLGDGDYYLTEVKSSEEDYNIKLSKISLFSYRKENILLKEQNESTKTLPEGTSKSFNVEFQGSTPSTTKIFMKSENGDRINPTCTASEGNTLSCNINDNTPIGSYKVYYTDSCEKERYANLTVVWIDDSSSVVLGKVSLDKSSCTSSIPSFSSSIISGDSLGLTDIYAKWNINVDNSGSSYPSLYHKCEAQNNNVLRCTPYRNTSISSGDYTLEKIEAASQTPSKLFTLSDKQQIIKYRLNYVSLQRAKEIEKVYENKTYFSLTFNEQTNGINEFNVRLTNNQTEKEISGRNVECNKTNDYSRIVNCYIKINITQNPGIYNVSYNNLCGEYEETGIQVNFTTEGPRYDIPSGSNSFGSFDLSSSLISFSSSVIILCLVSLL